jgi:hypothetical protein
LIAQRSVGRQWRRPVEPGQMGDKLEHVRPPVKTRGHGTGAAGFMQIIQVKIADQNGFFIGIGLGGAISTYPVPQPVIVWDLPFKLVVGVGLLASVWFVSDRALTRRAGAYLGVAYLVYVSLRVLLYSAQ